MLETRVVRKIYKWKPLTGRPKFRWKDDVRNDVRRMEIVKRPEQVQDRPKWKVIVEKANSHRVVVHKKKKKKKKYIILIIYLSHKLCPILLHNVANLVWNYRYNAT
jgi:hypothetical protein